MSEHPRILPPLASGGVEGEGGVKKNGDVTKTFGRDEKRRKVLTLCSFECDRREQQVYSIFTERARMLVSWAGKRKAEQRSVD